MKVKFIFMLMLSVLVLSACSKADKENAENSIRAIINAVEENVIVVESKDASYSGIISVNKEAANGTKLDFLPGDEINIYYNGEITGSNPATIENVQYFEIISSKESEDNVEDEVVNNEDPEDSEEGVSENNKSEDKNSNGSEEKPKTNQDRVKNEYYDLPLLGVTANGDTRQLKDNESALVHELADIVEWSVGVVKSNPDYIIIDDSGTVFDFDSKTGVLNNKEDDIHVKLHSELIAVLLLALNGDL